MAQRLFTPTTIGPCPIRPRFSKNDPYSPPVLFTPTSVVEEYNCVSISVLCVVILYKCVLIVYACESCIFFIKMRFVNHVFVLLSNLLLGRGN